FFLGERRRASLLGEAAVLAPEIRLVGHLGRDAVQSADRADSGRNRGGALRAGARSRHVGSELHLRKSGGPRHAILAPELLDARGGETHVVVVLQRLADEVLQLGITEQVPPGRVRERLRLRAGEPVLRGDVERRTLVLRADRARAHERRERSPAHACSSCDARARPRARRRRSVKRSIPAKKTGMNTTPSTVAAIIPPNTEVPSA